MSTRRAPCPQCERGPKDRALAITEDELGCVVYCHRCGYVAAQNRRDEWMHRLAVLVPRAAHRSCTDWSERAESIWQRTQPLRGTLGETYLRYRRCALPPPDSDLRYLSPQGSFGPALCARVTDVITGEPISLHFTRLAADGCGKAGTERDKTLLAGHRKRGGCIRLWPDKSVTYGLAIAEGIESALCAAHAFVPVWAMVDAGNLATFPVLRGIDSLSIFADNDEAGIQAAERCEKRWADAGREVCTVMPEQPGQDMADLVAA